MNGDNAGFSLSGIRTYSVCLQVEYQIPVGVRGSPRLRLQSICWSEEQHRAQQPDETWRHDTGDVRSQSLSDYRKRERASDADRQEGHLSTPPSPRRQALHERKTEEEAAEDHTRAPFPVSANRLTGSRTPSPCFPLTQVGYLNIVDTSSAPPVCNSIVISTCCWTTFCLSVFHFSLLALRALLDFQKGCESGNMACCRPDNSGTLSINLKGCF